MAWPLHIGGQPNSLRNLDFEATSLPVIPISESGQGRFISTEVALPGWTAFIGDRETQIVGHNWETLSSANIAVIGPEQSAFQLKYMVLMQSGPVVPDFSQHPVSIAQTGIIPSDVRSMRYSVDMLRENSLEVRFQNQVLTPQLLAVRERYSEYGIDVTGLAGQLGELRFTAVAIPGIIQNDVTLDLIRFSLLPVPEPEVVSLLLGGFGLFGWWGCRRRGGICEV